MGMPGKKRKKRPEAVNLLPSKEVIYVFSEP